MDIVYIDKHEDGSYLAVRFDLAWKLWRFGWQFQMASKVVEQIHREIEDYGKINGKWPKSCRNVTLYNMNTSYGVTYGSPAVRFVV